MRATVAVAVTATFTQQIASRALPIVKLFLAVSLAEFLLLGRSSSTQPKLREHISLDLKDACWETLRPNLRLTQRSAPGTFIRGSHTSSGELKHRTKKFKQGRTSSRGHPRTETPRTKFRGTRQRDSNGCDGSANYSSRTPFLFFKSPTFGA